MSFEITDRPELKIRNLKSHFDCQFLFVTKINCCIGTIEIGIAFFETGDISSLSTCWKLQLKNSGRRKECRRN